ncbi:MAG: hypothetical protein F6K35_50070, partial [Okeania sp. SIO2H7]|nr:hypothetical protein [Okeania sp. SIO2H7]
ERERQLATSVEEASSSEPEEPVASKAEAVASEPEPVASKAEAVASEPETEPVVESSSQTETSNSSPKEE